MQIPLGYEVGTGRAVSIPVNHTVVLGQTQLSGKTTTLEAMVTRSGVRAVGFITKPGEKSFRQQRQIPAFFMESTLGEYWKYVQSIVENLMAVKLGWRERGWIMKLCQDYDRKGKTKAQGYGWKHPRSLRELLDNVQTALPCVRGTEEMICIQLREYLKLVVKEIERTEFSSKLDLHPGINVMDVTELSDGLKALVIRSVLEWVHKHGRRTVVIIPEAWKFIPEGRSTPVKLALEGLIREGAGVSNFVWMDSQDLRGVDKMLLRSVIVWLFGVQRQKNEVANTLASIPDHPKPTATEIMQLGKGEFYVTYGTTLVRAYVQPAGMEDAHAQAIARGEESVESWKQIARALDDESKEAERHEAGEEEEREAVQDLLSHAQPSPTGDRVEVEHPGTEILSFDRASGPIRCDYSDSRPLRIEDPLATSHSSLATEGEAMWKEKYEALSEDHANLVQAHDALAERLRYLEGVADEVDSPDTPHSPLVTDSTIPKGEPGATKEGRPGTGGNGAAAGELGSAAPSNLKSLRDDESEFHLLYNKIRARAANDPGVLELLIRRPELRVRIERQVIEANGETLRGGLALLLSKGFFDSPKNGNTAFNELKRLGQRIARPNVYRELGKLAELGFLTYEESGYQAVSGMKVHVIEAGAKEARGKEAGSAR